jgi:thymidylate kinase
LLLFKCKALAKKYPERIITINAGACADEVHKLIVEQFEIKRNELLNTEY